MSKTEVSGKQLKDGSVQRVDLDVATSGQSVIAKVVAGSNISISSTGADTGTGDVTINLGGTIAADITSLDSRVDALEGDLATIQSAGAPNIADLGGVAITSPSSGQVLKYNGTGWANAADSTFSGAYADLTGKPSLATVATSGSYNDLTNKPSLATVATSGSYADLSNKPTLASFATLTSPANGQFLEYNGTAWVNANITASDVSGLATVATSGSYTDLSNKPTLVSSLDSLTDVAVTSAAKGQFIVHDGTQFVNSNTIEASGAAVKPLIVKGAASQTANLLEVQDSAGTNIFAVSSDAQNIVFNRSGASNAIVPAGSYVGGVTFRGWNGTGYNRAAGIYAAIDGTPGASNDMPGRFEFYTTADGEGDFVAERMRLNSSGNLGIGNGPFNPLARLHVDLGNNAGTPAVPGTRGILVKAAASQTANLFEVQNSGGTALFSVSSAGAVTAAANLQVSSDNIVVGKGPGASDVRVGNQNFTGAGTGGFNVAVGNVALNEKSTGQFNVGVGHWAAQSVTTGNDNTAVGAYAAGYLRGTHNTALGRNAGMGVDPFNASNNASYNVSIGAYTNQGMTTQQYSMAVGYNANAGSNALALGRTASAAQDCMDIRFGNASRITGDASGNVAIVNTLHAGRYTETVANAFNTSLAPSSGTLTVNTAGGNAVLGALSASVTTWAFTNVPTENSKVTTITVVLAGNASYTYGDACSVNGTAITNGIQWSGGSAPTATANTDIITFIIVRDSAGTVRVFGSATTNFS